MDYEIKDVQSINQLYSLYYRLNDNAEVIPADE